MGMDYAEFYRDASGYWRLKRLTKKRNRQVKS